MKRSDHRPDAVSQGNSELMKKHPSLQAEKAALERARFFSRVLKLPENLSWTHRSDSGTCRSITTESPEENTAQPGRSSVGCLM